MDANDALTNTDTLDLLAGRSVMLGRSNVFVSAAVACATALGAPGARAETDLFLPLSPETEDLEPYRWSSRPVLVFAPGPAERENRIL
jgi:hypothetical protein